MGRMQMLVYLILLHAAGRYVSHDISDSVAIKNYCAAIAGCMTLVAVAVVSGVLIWRLTTNQKG